MYTVSVFKNIFDTEVKSTEFEEWNQLEAVFKKDSEFPAEKGGHNSAPLISPAKYIEGSRRSNKNVIEWSGWCAVDVDSVQIDCEGRVEVLRNHLDAPLGKYYYVCYSTASSKPDYPKFRLLFPLTKSVLSEDIPHFWYALNKELGEMGDIQTKDKSRMFYVPGQYPDAWNFFFTSTHGDRMDPDALMHAWEYKKVTGNSFLDKLPESVREELLAHRKKQLTNTDVTWTSYRDCKFFPKKLANEYRTINETGWYHKMYQIMVATAGNAIKDNYPITATEISNLCRELDRETGNWYENRPFELEAQGAIEFVFANNI